MIEQYIGPIAITLFWLSVVLVFGWRCGVFKNKTPVAKYEIHQPHGCDGNKLAEELRHTLDNNSRFNQKGKDDE